jgi:hypothetical protein
VLGRASRKYSILRWLFYFIECLTNNIISVVNKVTLRACESGQRQISLVTAGGAPSDATANLFISNVGVLIANTKKAGITSKRATVFMG